MDKRVGLLSLHHADTQQRIGLIVVCSACANVLRGDNLLISGDFPGWKRVRLSVARDCR